jgi:hypothetical protein
MIATLLSRLRLPATLVFVSLAAVACGDKAPDRPAPPVMAAPAPPATVAPAEDRGHGTPAATSATADGTFAGVDSAESERAASERGHQSAGDKPVGKPEGGQ